MSKFKSFYASLFLLFSTLTPLQTQTINLEHQISVLIDTGSYAQAFNRLRALKTQEPSGAQYYLLSARLYYAMNSFPEALSNIQHSIQLSPKNPTNFLIMGNIMRQLGRLSDARTAYNQGISLDSGYGQLYFEIAQLSFSEQKYSEAERGLKLSQNFNPNSWANEVLASKLLLARGLTNEAEKQFLDLAYKYPQDAPVLQELANFYADQKKYEKASATLKEADIRFGTDLARSVQIGDYAFQRGAYNEALQYYNKVKSIFNDHPFSGSALVNWRLYQLALQNQDMTSAERNLRASFEQNPANQLYISAFNRFLSQNYPPNNSYRAVMSSFLAKIASKERNSGYGSYYLSIIYKQILSDPFNSAPYKELVNYAKIKKDDHAISSLMRSMASILPDKEKIETQLRIRDRLAATGRLNIRAQKLYPYKSIFFIEDTIYQSAHPFAEELKFYNPLFPKINVATSEKSFLEESRNLFRSGTVGLAVHIQIHPGFMQVQIFDKTGNLIRTQNMPYSPEYFTENILALIKNVHDMLTPIAYLDERLPNNVFRVGLGSKDKIKAGDKLSVYDSNFKSTSELQIVETQSASSTASLSSDKIISLGNGSDFYVFPSELSERISPERLFIPEGSTILNMDPFDPYNKALEELQL